MKEREDSVPLSACGEGLGERLTRVATPPPAPSPRARSGEHPFKLHLVEGTGLKRLFFSIIVGLVLSYVGLLLYGTMFAERMIFLPPVTNYRDTSSTLKLKSGDGIEISAAYLPNPEATYTILFSHGNAEDLGTLAPELENIRALGFSIFAYDYHGYGTSGGKATEQNAYEDIDAAYNYLTQVLKVPPDRIIAHGRSLGGAVAIDLASRKPLGGLVVESSFVSAFRVVTGYRIFPFDKFRNADKIKAVRCPVLIIHGRQDEVIPFWHGERLFELANEPKMNFWADGAGHNNLKPVAGAEYVKSLQAFRDSLATLK
ncbi:MAG TPA: alpha/beta hydrolase [Pyrinomonadaceae bacterium]|nr:alpha/beta hydrolase [Pyrinomonadaceae bacterium]